MAIQQNDYYNGNTSLKKAGSTVEYTPELITEFKKCKDDIFHFAEKYFTIVSLDKGKIKIPLYDYQRDLLQQFIDERFSIVLASRQSAKTTSATIFLLHFILFNKDKNIVILANRAKTARMILQRIKLAFELLPIWLKPGVNEWNKGSIEFENGCKIFADSTTGSAARGDSISVLYIDECAFIENNWSEFYSSVYPTISSGKSTKILLISTANGMNHFYKIWADAISGKSNYVPFEVSWEDVPGRDQEWKEEQIANTSEEQFEQEFNNSFHGSSGTLLNNKTIKLLTDGIQKPISSNETLRIYEEPIPNHTYIQIVDTANGKKLDKSAISVIDISRTPYKQVAVYYDNKIKPIAYPSVINYIGLKYNEAYTLIELNDAGNLVVNYINYELEYPNIITPIIKDDLGIRTTKKVKSIGCLTMRDIIENDKLQIVDEWTINELSSFIHKGSSFEADTGKNDDLCATLFLFSYLTTLEFFEDLTDKAFLNELNDEWYNESDMLPIGAVNNGMDNVEKTDW